MTAFASLSRRQQIARVRRSATAALPRFDLTDARLRLIAHDYNSTFRVDTAHGERFALRLNLNMARPIEEIRGEAAWVEAIAAETDVVVPRPRRTLDGDHVAVVPCAGLGRDLTAVVYEWLEGRNLGTSARPGQVHDIGRSAAMLHEHAQQWRLPANASRPVFDSLLMDAADHLSGVDAAWYTPELRRLVDDTRVRLDDVLGASLSRSSGAFGLIHGDLHLWNARSTRRGVAVFDFDDCGVGTPVQDLAISAFYLRPHDGFETAMLDGYRSVRDLDLGDGSVFEGHLAARSLLLMNELAGSVNAAHVGLIQTYADTTTRRLRHYLATGHFRHDPLP